MQQIRLIVAVLFLFLLSTNLAWGQDDAKLKAAQKRIAELERSLAGDRRSFQLATEIYDNETKSLTKKVDQLQADLRRFKNIGEAESDGLLHLLRQPIDTRGLQEKVKLSVAIEYLADKFGGKLPILLYREAFGPGTNPYEDEVSLPPVPSKMATATALRLLLSQVAKGQATYIIRGTHLEIVPLKYHTARTFLYEPSIIAKFEKRSLSDVLQALSDESGVKVHLDPQVRKGEAISASFRNSSLEDALVVVTEMAQLKYVVLERSILVTSRENAKIVEQEEVERRKQRSTLRRVMPLATKRLEPAAE